MNVVEWLNDDSLHGPRAVGQAFAQMVGATFGIVKAGPTLRAMSIESNQFRFKVMPTIHDWIVISEAVGSPIKKERHSSFEGCIGCAVRKLAFWGIALPKLGVIRTPALQSDLGQWYREPPCPRVRMMQRVVKEAAECPAIGPKGEELAQQAELLLISHLDQEREQWGECGGRWDKPNATNRPR